MQTIPPFPSERTSLPRPSPAASAASPQRIPAPTCPSMNLEICFLHEVAATENRSVHSPAQPSAGRYRRRLPCVLSGPRGDLSHSTRSTRGNGDIWTGMALRSIDSAYSCETIGRVRGLGWAKLDSVGWLMPQVYMPITIAIRIFALPTRALMTL